MDEKDIERLAELISIKTADKYLAITKEMMANSIKLHAADCEANKYRGIKHFVSAGIGGIIVATAGWILKKL